MKLIEMRELPKKVGEAVISFGKEDVVPERKGQKIILPGNPEMDFFWINNQLQFLLYYYFCGYNQGQDNEKRESPMCWFGGMDESPFLVRLNPACYHTLIRKGEQDFFEALKPKKVRVIEKFAEMQAKRQGDIFSVELPFTLQQLQVAGKALGGNIPVPEHKGQRFNLFGTRHQAEAELSSSTSGNENNIVIKEALLKAPDHCDLELPALHFLAQADGLYSPKEAD